MCLTSPAVATLGLLGLHHFVAMHPYSLSDCLLPSGALMDVSQNDDGGVINGADDIQERKSAGTSS